MHRRLQELLRDLDRRHPLPGLSRRAVVKLESFSPGREVEPTPERLRREAIQAIENVFPGSVVETYNPTPLPYPTKPPLTGPVTGTSVRLGMAQKQEKTGAPGTGLAFRRTMRLWERFGGVCYLCGTPVRRPDPQDNTSDDRASADHVVPISHGGGSTIDNLRLAHQCCNNWRGTNPVTEDLKEKIQRLMKDLLTTSPHGK